ncbi:MAG: hypothetical protein RSD01_03075 [Ruthenibacterium sp.]
MVLSSGLRCRHPMMAASLPDSYGKNTGKHQNSLKKALIEKTIAWCKTRLAQGVMILKRRNHT